MLNPPRRRQLPKAHGPPWWPSLVGEGAGVEGGENHCFSHGKTRGKWWKPKENRRKTIGNRENYGKTIGKPWENHGRWWKPWKTRGKPRENGENNGKTMRKPWENGDITGKHGDLHGIYSWFIADLWYVGANQVQFHVGLYCGYWGSIFTILYLIGFIYIYQIITEGGTQLITPTQFLSGWWFQTLLLSISYLG